MEVVAGRIPLWDLPQNLLPDLKSLGLLVLRVKTSKSYFEWESEGHKGKGG